MTAQFLPTTKAWVWVGHLTGEGMRTTHSLEKWLTQQLLGSKEQAKPEACSKSRHSLVEEPALEGGGAPDTMGAAWSIFGKELRRCMAEAATPGQGGAGTVDLLGSLGFFCGPDAYNCC